MSWTSPPPSDNVFIGDLPVEFDKQQLQDVFEAYGTVVDCRHLPPKNEGAKSSALLRFGSVAEAQWLVDNLNGNLAEGLEEPIIVRFANSPSAKGDKGDKGWGKGGDKGKSAPAWSAPAAGGAPGRSDNLWIGDLPSDFTQEQLTEVFTAYGTVVQCRVLPVKQEGSPLCAMVRFSSVDEASWIVDNLNGNIAEGMDTPIAVRHANQGKQDGGSWGKAAAAEAPSKGASPYGKGGYKAPAKGGKGVGKDGMPESAASLCKGLFKGGVFGDQGKSKTPDECVCYVSNLPHDMTDIDLYKVFSPYGSIPPNGVKVMTDQSTGFCDGRGFVDFNHPEEAATAVLALNEFVTQDGSFISVSTKTKRTHNDKGGGKGKGDDWGGKGGKGKW